MAVFFTLLFKILCTQLFNRYTTNSSEDEIANANFLYDDIVHVPQNTIDSCINSATDRRGYVLEHRFTKFSEKTQSSGHYAVQGHSRSPILVPVGSSYDFLWVINAYILSCTVSKLWRIISQIFASNRGLSHFIDPANIAISDISLKLDSLAYISAAESIIIFNHFYVIRPISYLLRWNYAAVKTITPFKVIQGHRVWYQSKAHSLWTSY